MVASVQFYVKKSYCIQQNVFVKWKCLYWTLFTSEVTQKKSYGGLHIKDPSERHSFLILLAPLIKECCPLKPYTQKKITHVVSVCINVDCMSVEFFSVHVSAFRGFTALCFCINTQDTAVMTVGAFHLPSGEL